MNTSTATTLPTRTVSKLMSRSEAFERCPALAEKITALAVRIAQSPMVWQAGGLISDVAELPGLELEGPSHGASALILCLPSIFEPSLMQFVTQTPTIICTHSVDLLQQFSLASWQIASGDSVCIQLDALEYMIDRCKPDNARMSKWRRKSVPVLMLAGDSVAMGGFRIDDAWDEKLITERQVEQANYKPRHEHKEGVLEKAASEARRWGRLPWEHEVWLDEDGHITMVPPIWY